MNKSILLIVLPCLISAVMVSAMLPGMSHQTGYPYYYNNQLNAYRMQTGYYNYGNAATAQLRTSRLLNYLFGFLLLLDLTNATGNTLTALG